MKNPAESISGSTATLSVVFSRFGTFAMAGPSAALELPHPAPRSINDAAKISAVTYGLLLTIVNSGNTSVGSPLPTHQHASPAVVVRILDFYSVTYVAWRTLSLPDPRAARTTNCLRGREMGSERRGSPGGGLDHQ